MNKTEFIQMVAIRSKKPVAVVSEVINVALEGLTKVIVKGDKVTLTGFGTFVAKKRNARKGRNPKTGAAIKIRARKVARFMPGQKLKEAVDKGK